MNWYCVRDGKQDGPHSEEAIRQLAKSRLIDFSTLVWREGMEGWQPISHAAPDLIEVTPPPPAPKPAVKAGEVRCGECGEVFPASEMVGLRDAQVCARCKPLRLQKIQEGVATGDRQVQLARLLKIAKAQSGQIQARPALELRCL